MRWFKDFTGISRRTRRRRCFLGLERLEERVALATFMVTNLGDSGDGSLRQAIVDSNSSTPGPNEIDFAPGLSGTIALTSGELQITNEVRIVGPGADALSVSGNNASRVFEVDQANTAISGLTITGGHTSDVGGGIFNNGGTLRIDTSTISGNSADDLGGGIYNGGTASITDSLISGNSAGGVGGGLENGGMATVSGCTFTSNSSIDGGGIDNRGTATVSGCTFISNSSALAAASLMNRSPVARR